jgi:adhesin/invasin
VPGVAVAFAATTPGGAIAPLLATTGPAGTATVTVSVGQAAGPYDFTATADALVAPLRVAATSGRPSALRLQPLSPTATFDCGCVDAVITAVDAFGNRVAAPVAGVTAMLSGAALIASTDLGAVGAAASSVSGSLLPDGSAIVRACGTRPGAVTLTASSATLAGAALALDFQLGPADVAASTVTSDASVLVAWSGHATVRVVPRSACGNAEGAGRPVVLSLDGPGTLSPTVDLGDGSYTATLTVAPCPTIASTRVLALVDGVALAPLDVRIACAQVSPENTDVTLSRHEVQVCDDPARDQVAFTVFPRDPAGAPLGPGNSVALSVEGLVGGSAVDQRDGSYTGTFTVDRCGPGPRPVTVHVNGVDITRGDYALAFPCAPIDPSASGVTVGRARAAVGDAVDVTVAATNACGKPARARTVTLAAELAVPVSASGITDSAGTFGTTLQSSRAGADRVSASVDGVALPTVALAWDAPRTGGCATGGDAVTALAAIAIWLVGVRCRNRLRS